MKGRPTFFEFVNGMSFNGSKKTVWIKSKKTGEVFGVRGKTAMLISIMQGVFYVFVVVGGGFLIRYLRDVVAPTRFVYYVVGIVLAELVLLFAYLVCCYFLIRFKRRKLTGNRVQTHTTTEQI